MGKQLGTGEVLQSKMPRFARSSGFTREMNRTTDISRAPWIDFGGTGSHTIHLAHANGFPTASYRQLAANLSLDFKVIGMNARAMWPGSAPYDLKSWRLAAEDIIRFLEWRGTGPIIGMGHSFGGICTLLAANMRPDLFMAVVLIEPVLLPRWVYLLGDVFPKSILRHISPVASQALKRKDRWPTRQEMFAQYREKKVFSGMNDAALWDYVRAVAVDEADGTIRLGYSKEWEAQVFLTVHKPYAELKGLRQPMLAIRGAHSDTIRPEVWQQWRDGDRNPTHRFVEMVGAGHMLPFEQPSAVADAVRTFLSSTGVGH